MEKIKKPFYKRAWFYIVTVLLLFVLAVVITYFSSYGIQKIIIGLVCQDKNPSTPADYAQIVERTERISDIKYYDGYENSYLDVLSPKDNEEPLPLVVYIHGGYYAGGDKAGKEPYCRVIADKGYIVANINYALAPDEKYPSQLLQANAALAYLVQNAAEYNIDVNNIFIGGDSAGGHLSGQLGCFYTNLSFSDYFNAAPAISAVQLKGVLLLCGFFNIDTLRATKFPLLAEAMWMFTGEREFEKSKYAALINTIGNVNADYPPTYIVCGDKDPFYAQNQEMAARLKELGVTVADYLPNTTDKNLEHEFQCNFSLPECAIGLEKLFTFMRDAVV